MVFKHKDIGPELTRTEWEAVDAHEGVLSVSQIPITSLWLKGLFASRPAASVEGRHYWATDTDEIFRDTGSAWEQVMESVALKAGDYPTAYVGISASATGRAALIGKTLKYKTPATLNAYQPVADTWHTILDTTTNVSLDYVLVYHSYSEARLLDVKLTIDGVVLELNDWDAPQLTTFYIVTAANHTGGLLLDKTETKTLFNVEGSLEGQSVKVEVHNQEVITAGAYLKAAAYYHRLE